jgi:hypothetical protein
VNVTYVTEVAFVDVTSKIYHACDDLKYSSQEIVSRMVIWADTELKSGAWLWEDKR